VPEYNFLISKNLMADTGYIKSLDGIRALALLMIMTYHAELAHFTWISVQLFFVLSGYLITGILWKEKFKTESTSFKFKKFWVRRSLRIFPLYFGFLAIITASYLIFNFPSYFTKYFPFLITYTVNYSRLIPGWQGNPLFTHLWTLSIEEQFYFIFPLIIFFCSPKFIKYFLLSLLFISPLCRYIIGEFYKNQGLPSAVIADVVYWNTLSHLDAFCIGGIIPVFQLSGKIKKPIWVLRIVFLFGLIAGILNYFYSDSKLSYWDDFGYNHWLIGNFQHVWHYSILNAFCGALILVLVSKNSENSIPRTRKFLEHPWIVRIGKVSYGMYLFHWIVLTYLFYNLIKPETYIHKLLLFIPYVLVVYTISEISYSLFESKFIKLKDKFFTLPQKRNTSENLLIDQITEVK
jgi:peptidoglycan/LPS O-acetylase OafA/YrhL